MITNREVDSVDEALLWNLCEYGISTRVIQVLYDNNVSLSMLNLMDEEKFSQMFTTRKNTFFRKIKHVLHTELKDKELEISMYYLFSVGLSIRIIENCIDKNIKFKNLKYLNQSVLYNSYGFSLSNSRKIIDAYNTVSIDKNYLNDYKDNLFVKNIIDNPAFRETIKNYIYDYVDQSKEALRMSDLATGLPEYLEVEDIKNIIEEMVLEKKVSFDGELVERNVSTLNDFINSIDNKRKKEIFLKRLDGKTFEEIGEVYSITRERVRQIIKNILKGKPSLKEDKYKVIFEKYNFSKSDFVKIFQCSENIYNYLNNIYKKGDAAISDILEDDTVSQEVKKRVEEIVYKDYIYIDNIRIPLNKTSIVKYIVKKYCKERRSVKEILNIYNDFIFEKNIGQSDEFIISERYFANIVHDLHIVIYGYNKMFRYYDMNEYDFEYFLDELNLSQYNNISISTLKIYRSYRDLMTQYDIRDEYELHNLLKKLLSNENIYDIKFSRMPMIEFGQADRSMMVLDLIIEYAPISIDELAERFEEEYGVRANTVKANYLKEFDEYYHNGIYDIDKKQLSNEDFQVLKNELDKEFYFIDDVKKIFLDKLDNCDTDLINSYNIKRLGFRINSKYIFSNKYSYVDEYFRKIVCVDNILDLNNIDRRIFTIQAFNNLLSEQRDSYNLIEFEYNKFISISRLQECGIYKEDLIGYCNRVLEFIGEGKYFTFKYLKSNGFKDKLDELGFDEMFYCSLIRSNKEISFRRLSNTYIFKIGEEEITIKSFIEYLMIKFKSIDIYNLVEYLKDTYDIQISTWKVKELIRESSLHYDDITEKIYIDYNEYFSEI